MDPCPPTIRVRGITAERDDTPTRIMVKFKEQLLQTFTLNLINPSVYNIMFQF